MIKTSFVSFGRRAQVALLVIASAAASVTLGAGYVKASTEACAHDDEMEIAKLPLCYARGTDAIGRGDVAQGKSIYNHCFTNNAELSVYFPGTPFNGPPSYVTNGTDSWGDFVSATFTGNGYVATQHLMGNIEVHQDSPTHATMTSYLSATHAVNDGTIDTAQGTYEDEVVRRNGVWKIKTRTLKLITFVNIGNVP